MKNDNNRDPKRSPQSKRLALAQKAARDLKARGFRVTRAEVLK